MGLDMKRMEVQTDVVMEVMRKGKGLNQMDLVLNGKDGVLFWLFFEKPPAHPLIVPSS